ncbi:MAG TPA: carboxylesterase family protein, partial [Steroidobacteraceae bacterium]
LRDRAPVAIDIYNNDIYNTDDNCIEADGGAHNIRVFRNRCFNSTGGAFSAQPTFGGPLYFFRNIAYGTTTGGYMKLVDTPAGVMFYQNTLIGQVRYSGPAANIHFRNNLILSDGWSSEVFALRTTTNYSTSDYNGFRPNPGGEAAFEWDSPARAVAADFTHPLEVRKFRTLAEYAAGTGEDAHSRAIDFDSFVQAAIPDKADPQRLYNPEDFDFRLQPGSPAVDAGVDLPTITDGFTGKAPDLGAYELGQPVPHYGPLSQPPGVVAADAPRSMKGPPQAPVAYINSGGLSGAQQGGVATFLGIPFAAPPVGPDRWRAPRPVRSWQGTRDASHFGASCYQVLTPQGFGPWKHEFVVQGEVSEDCLFVNVWTPKVDAKARLPVFVWIHGGGFSQGSGSVAVYDGTSLAGDGIVVVNFNYRMGVFGFLAHPELTREAGHDSPPGNYGLQDMIAALQWVRDNIAAFGGDPDQVTLAGQSAGAMAIHDLLVSPLAAGLFKRVIIQSGLPNIRKATALAAAEKVGEDFAHSRNAATLESLRAVPPAELLGPAQAQGPRFGPIIDGMLLPDSAEKRSASGQFDDTPVMIGMVADEGSAFSPSYRAADESGFTARERGLGALYAWGRERLSLGKQPVYVYMFAHVEPGPDSGRYAAFHSSELPYAFRTFEKSPERDFTAADRALARVVSAYWVNFVKTGDPNGPAVPSWPRLLAADPQIMRLDVNSTAQPLLPGPRLQAMRDYLAHGGNPSLF